MDCGVEIHVDGEVEKVLTLYFLTCSCRMNAKIGSAKHVNESPKVPTHDAGLFCIELDRKKYGYSIKCVPSSLVTIKEIAYVEQNVITGNALTAISNGNVGNIRGCGMILTVTVK